jgi:crossover junction endodeoxyribonuclease RusA
VSQAELSGLGWPFSAISFRVFGMPFPKGSMKPVYRLGAGGRLIGRVQLVPDNPPALKRWSAAVAGSAIAAIPRGPARPFFRDRPLACEITFVLERATKTAQKANWAHYAQGDLDKLVRATLDPMEGLVFDNDRRICELTSRKRYEEPGAGVPLGALVSVWPLDAA